MATGWPTVDDVKRWLRLGPAATDDDEVIAQDLAAAIAATTSECPAPTDPASPDFLPDDLFLATMMDAGRLVRRRDSVDGTLGWGDSGIVRVGQKDPDIQRLKAPWLAMVIG
jgi:hypothetical protein